MADQGLKAMSADQLRTFIGEQKKVGKTASTSKSVGEAQDLLNVLKAKDRGDTNSATASEAMRKLSSGVTSPTGWSAQNVPGFTGDTSSLTSETLPSYLDAYGNASFNNLNSPETKLTGTSSNPLSFLQNTPAPAPLDRAATRADLRTQYGVSDLEKSLTDLKSQEADLQAQLRTNTNAELGKPVALNVISGRITEQQRQAQDQLDFIGRQKAVVVDELNTKYSIIDTFMQDKSLDYQDAVQAYESKYNKALQMYSLIQDQLDKQVASARANLQIYTNAITSGNLSYSSLSSDQKLMIKKLEVQSGLPVGLVSSLKMNPKDSILNVNSDTGEALILNGDGTFKVVKTGMTVKSTTGSGAAGFNSAISAGIDDLKGGENWGTVWNRVKSAYPDASNESIDAGLGTEWREGNAYEAYKAKTSSTNTNTDSSSALRDAVSAFNKAISKEQKAAVRAAFAQDYPALIKQYDDATAI